MPSPRRAFVDVAAAPDLEAVSAAPRRATQLISDAPSLNKQRRAVGAWRRSLAPLAAMATFSAVVGLGVAAPRPVTAKAPEIQQVSLADTTVLDRPWANSRSVFRPTVEATPSASAAPVATQPAPEATVVATPTPTPVTPAMGKVVGAKYATTSGINVRSDASTSAEVLGTLARAAEVKVTDVTVGDWQQISYNGKAAWVAAKFLESGKPAAAPASDVAIPASGNYSNESCRYGASIESGITANTKRVFRAFCAVFPSITSYGGYRAAERWSYHTRGAAIDAMVSDSTLGWQMAKWAVANADALHIDQVIYSRQIWTKQNPTWRTMRDQGSVTANHYDHVHISVG